jgi:hypothetical protein
MFAADVLAQQSLVDRSRARTGSREAHPDMVGQVSDNQLLAMAEEE